MNTLLANQLGELLAPPVHPRDVLYESQMRVAAGTLQQASVDVVTATTVVGIVGAEDRAAFEALAHRIADECGVEARIRWRDQSFSVRFNRQPALPEAALRHGGAKGLLQGLLSNLHVGR